MLLCMVCMGAWAETVPTFPVYSDLRVSTDAVSYEFYLKNNDNQHYLFANSITASTQPGWLGGTSNNPSRFRFKNSTTEGYYNIEAKIGNNWYIVGCTGNAQSTGNAGSQTSAVRAYSADAQNTDWKVVVKNPKSVLIYPKRDDSNIYSWNMYKGAGNWLGLWDDGTGSAWTLVSADTNPTFTIINPDDSSTADGRGTLVCWTGNDNAGTDTPIAVDMKAAYTRDYSHSGGWPTTATAENVFSEWAVYISPTTQKKYIYNVHNARFLAVGSNQLGGHYVTKFNDMPQSLEVVTDGNYFKIKNLSDNKHLCFTPGYGRDNGYYTIWHDEAASNRITMKATGNTVDSKILALVEAEVAIAEATEPSTYVGEFGANAQQILASKISQTIKTTDERYAQIPNAKNPIDESKFYVIESACSAFTDETPRAIYADYGSSHTNGNNTYPDYLKWKNYSADDNSFIFRFQKEKQYSSAVTWTTYTPTQTATDVYSIYNVAAPQNAYVGVADYNGRYGMRKRGELAVGNNNNGSARGNDGGIFAVLPIASTTNQFAIVARFNGNGWTENKMDCSTMSVKQGSNPTANTASGDVYTYNSAAAANDYHAWRIREVDAPVLEKKAVSITSVGVATFYTGKTLAIPEGVTAKKVVDAENAQQGDVYHLVYKELQDEIPAGTAVVLFGEENPSYQFPRSLEPHDYIVTNAAGDENNRLIGTLASDVTATGKGQDGTLYALGNKDAGVAFYHFLGETLTAGKAYLDASGIGVSGVRAFAIFDEGTGTVTNIDALTGAAIGEDTAYDLAGRRVKAQAKGISIVNGKKVIR